MGGLEELEMKGVVAGAAGLVCDHCVSDDRGNTPRGRRGRGAECVCVLRVELDQVFNRRHQTAHTGVPIATEKQTTNFNRSVRTREVSSLR